MNLLLGFLAGAFITNSLPHMVTGIAGQSHMTPLSKDSSAIINVVWAFVNLVVGFWLLNSSGISMNDVFQMTSASYPFWVGSFVLALTAAWMFSNKNMRFPWFK